MIYAWEDQENATSPSDAEEDRPTWLNYVR